jgi:hypothetical protein
MDVGGRLDVSGCTSATRGRACRRRGPRPDRTNRRASGTNERTQPRDDEPASASRPGRCQRRPKVDPVANPRVARGSVSGVVDTCDAGLHNGELRGRPPRTENYRKGRPRFMDYSDMHKAKLRLECANRRLTCQNRSDGGRRLIEIVAH